ncbi:MAG: SDR family oxidoreductase [Candidatus Aenigmatarchaeota archaeon]|nr:MAG: SDR family oxidoreductase [Candidatus Aenigmarchaeota archaeon]
MSGKDIVVTGGAGFIGSWIAETLSSENKVTVIDNLHTGKMKNLKGFADRIRFINADIRDREAVFEGVKGAELVFHQGANVIIQASIDDPKMNSEINVGGTLNVLEACRKHDVKRVIFASSSAIYGNTEKLPVTEDQDPSPLSPYALSKLEGEKWMKIYSEKYGLETVTLRYFNVYGPRQYPDSPYSGVISIFTKNIRTGKPLTVFGDGEQTRDFVSVRDVVNANLLAAESRKGVGKTFNIGTGKSVSLNEMISILEKLAGKKTKVVYDKPRHGDVRHSRADITLAKDVLGYSPAVSLEEGLKELLFP